MTDQLFRKDSKAITANSTMKVLNNYKKHHDRSGFTATEMLVAATLLVSAIAVVSPLTVKTGRLWQDTRHYRLALDELSNQLEQLTLLQADELEAALEELTPSPMAIRVLVNPELTAERFNDADGARLKLSLRWDRPGGSPPLGLVAWLDESPAEEAVP